MGISTISMVIFHSYVSLPKSIMNPTAACRLDFWLPMSTWEIQIHIFSMAGGAGSAIGDFSPQSSPQTSFSFWMTFYKRGSSAIFYKLDQKGPSSNQHWQSLVLHGHPTLRHPSFATAAGHRSSALPTPKPSWTSSKRPPNAILAILRRFSSLAMFNWLV